MSLVPSSASSELLPVPVEGWLHDALRRSVWGEQDEFVLVADEPSQAIGMPAMEALWGSAHQPEVMSLLDRLPAPVMAISCGDEPRILYWNPECELLLGYTASEVLQVPGMLARLRPQADSLQRTLASLLEQASACRGLVWPLCAKDGRARRLAWSAFAGAGLGPEVEGEVLWLLGTDVARRAEAEHLLRAHDKLLRLLFRFLPDMVHLKDGQGRWLLANPPALAFLGLGEEDVSGRANLELAEQHPELADVLRMSALNEEATWQSGKVTHLQEVTDDGKGGERSFDVVRVPVFGRGGERLQMLVVRRDVTDQRSVATKLELAGRVLDQSTDGIMISDANGQIMMVNAAFSTLSGYSATEAVGQGHGLLLSEQHEEAFQAQMWESVHRDGAWSGEVWGRRKNGEVYPQWLKLSALRHRASGEITHYVAAFSDLSSRKAAEEQIAYLSTQDVVTGLPNRNQAAMRADMALAHAQASGERVALMVIDIDNFKTLNDSLGHAAGDLLLREVGQRLARFAGPQAVVGRLSGDEFMLMQVGVAGTNEAAHAAQAMMEAVAQPVTLGGLPVNVSISAGVAMFPADGESFDALFGRADAALYAAKRDGRAAYQFATAAMNDAALERLQLELALRQAVESEALRLEYQPLVELSSGRIIGVEALCRWDDPVRGPVPPGIFIPLAEDTGLIEALGGWVLRESARQLKVWHDQGHHGLILAVNLSARQFQRGVVLAQVEHALETSGVAPDRLELELTESVLLHDGEAVMSTLRQLKALGVKLAIDDFGTGYSSFAYLRRFKFDKIKIDQSFVRDLIDDPDDAAIVRGIISLALSLGLHVLAEGVETEAIAHRLKTLKCTYAQGYHFARPLRPEALGALLDGR